LNQRSAPLRLDKFLYFCRFAKSRSKAQALVAGGNPRISGHPELSLHAEVKAGETLTIMLAGQVQVLHILSLPVRRGPALEAQSHYSSLSPREAIDADGS
jgi:ribosome-associated heat shock protein Hsp15